MKPSTQLFDVRLTSVKWLSEKVYEAVFERPAGFSFTPGQTVRFIDGGIKRDYTIISHPDDSMIQCVIRYLKDGKFSGTLPYQPVGSLFSITGPHGYFRYIPSDQPPVFVATGTGIAPFVAFARNNIKGFTLLHGVSSIKETYYRELLIEAAASCVPCVSSGFSGDGNNMDHSVFSGRVTRYAQEMLPAGCYDFYLCGNDEMIADMMDIADERFPGSRVYSEHFS